MRHRSPVFCQFVVSREKGKVMCSKVLKRLCLPHIIQTEKEKADHHPISPEKDEPKECYWYFSPYSL